VLTTIVGKTADLLDKRFLVGSLLPCLGFGAAIGSLVITGIGWTETHKVVRSIPNSERWLIGVVAAAALLLLAVLLGTQINRLVVWWEGYWRPKCLGRPFVCLQRRRYRRLNDDDPWDSTRMFREFPSDDSDFLPTRLGNTLLAAENYSRARYGIDSVLFWPRLYLLLDEPERAIVDDARRAVDQFVVLATLSATASFVAVGMGLSGFVSGIVVVPSALGAAVLAYLTYRSAVTAAITFGDLVRSVFDLYRRKLLFEIGIAPAKGPEEERRVWEALSKYLLRGATDTGDESLIRYTTPLK
jgi:hypothetical protein